MRTINYSLLQVIMGNTPEYNHTRYMQMKENGSCPRCKKPMDRKGALCTSCRAKAIIYERETRAFLRANRICPYCRKNKLYENEKRCYDCYIKVAEYREKNKPTEEQRGRYRRSFETAQRSLYQERSEKGICTRCGKRKAMPCKKKCGVCLEEDRIYHLKKRKTGNISQERLEKGLCYFCGKPAMKGNTICIDCHKKCGDRASKQNKK